MTNVKTRRPQWHARFSRGPGLKRTKYIPIGAHILEHDREGAIADAARWAPKARTVPRGPSETVEQYAKRWLAEREKRVVSIKDDTARLRDHVLPLLGPELVRTFGRDEVESVRDELDAKVASGELSWKTARNVWTLVKTLCDDLVNARLRELRVRADNPSIGVKPPLRGARREKQFLWPSEFRRFVNCPEVPRKWKVATSLALYTYGRDGEVADLEGPDFLEEHGVLRIVHARDRDTGAQKGTKTGGTRRFSVERNLLPLLNSLKKRAGKGKLFDFDATHLSRTFRRWLKVAKVDRPELHEPTAVSRPITWHDLRATAATWMAVRGDKPFVIRDRCGHKNVSTTEIYIREGEVLADGFGEVFPPLPDLVGKDPPEAIARVLPFATAASRKSQKQALSERDTGLEPATFGLGTPRRVRKPPGLSLS
jgi:integrase